MNAIEKQLYTLPNHRRYIILYSFFYCFTFINLSVTTIDLQNLESSGVRLA